MGMKVMLFVMGLLTLMVKGDLNDRPIVAVLDLETESPYGWSYIAAGYVKWAESGGMRVVPMFLNSTYDEIDLILKSVNGFVFPGGSTVLEGRHWQTLKHIFNTVYQMNLNGNYFPVWGTCLGFEEIITLFVDDPNIIAKPFDAFYLSWPLIFTEHARSSYMFKNVPESMMQIFEQQNVTFNNHGMGISVQDFEANDILMSNFTILSTNYDVAGTHFVSTIEHKKYPIFGVQWHPEKIAYEWNAENINHSGDSVRVNQWTAQFFGGEVRKNTNKFATEELEQSMLIYNYDATYVAPITHFMEAYYFSVPLKDN